MMQVIQVKHNGDKTCACAHLFTHTKYSEPCRAREWYSQATKGQLFENWLLLGIEGIHTRTHTPILQRITRCARIVKPESNTVRTQTRIYTIISITPLSVRVHLMLA